MTGLSANEIVKRLQEEETVDSSGAWTALDFKPIVEKILTRYRPMASECQLESMIKTLDGVEGHHKMTTKY